MITPGVGVRKVHWTIQHNWLPSLITCALAESGTGPGGGDTGAPCGGTHGARKRTSWLATESEQQRYQIIARFLRACGQLRGEAPQARPPFVGKGGALDKLVALQVLARVRRLAPAQDASKAASRRAWKPTEIKIVGSNTAPPVRSGETPARQLHSFDASPRDQSGCSGCSPSPFVGARLGWPRCIVSWPEQMLNFFLCGTTPFDHQAASCPGLSRCSCPLSATRQGPGRGLCSGVARRQ